MNLGKNFSKKYLVNLFGQLAISYDFIQLITVCIKDIKFYYNS